MQRKAECAYHDALKGMCTCLEIKRSDKLFLLQDKFHFHGNRCRCKQSDKKLILNNIHAPCKQDSPHFLFMQQCFKQKQKTFIVVLCLQVLGATENPIVENL